MPAEADNKRDSLLIRDASFKLLAGLPKPEFMLIGAAKSGTSSFSSYLPLHPQVKACAPKEPNFWSWQRCTRQQYQSLFVNSRPQHPPQQIGGEYSTSSLLHPLVPRRVKPRLPQLKIIVLLRNPVDRAYSHYVMVQRSSGEPSCSFEELIAREMAEVPVLLQAHQRGFLDPSSTTQAHRCGLDGVPIVVAAQDAGGSSYSLVSEADLFRYYTTSCIFRSLYHDQLWRWLQLFPRQQVKIIETEQLRADRARVMNEVVEFLGLAPYDFPAAELQHITALGSSEHSTPSDYAPMKRATRESLEQFFAPYNARLFELIGEQYDW